MLHVSNKLIPAFNNVVLRLLNEHAMASHGDETNKSYPVGKHLFKVSKITLEQRSLNVVRTLFC